MYDDFCFFVQNFIFCGAGYFFWYVFNFILSKEDFAFKIKESFIRIKVELFRYDLRELTLYFLGDTKKKERHKKHKRKSKQENGKRKEKQEKKKKRKSKTKKRSSFKKRGCQPSPN